MLAKQIRATTTFGLILFALSQANAQSLPAPLEVPNSPIPVHVLAQSPADTKAELQIICLFQSTAENTLHGSLAEMNQKLGGLLDQIRKPDNFAGELGETLLLTPPEGKVSAKQILVVGLGDSKSFTPLRMELVGAVAYREAGQLGVEHLFFAPTVLDGGVRQFTTGETSEWFMRGFLRAMITHKYLVNSGYAEKSRIADLTYLAGAAHSGDTRDGIAKALSHAEKP